MKKVYKWICLGFVCFAACFVTTGLMITAADSQETDASAELVRKECRFYTEEEMAERDRLFDEVFFWEAQRRMHGVLVPEEVSGPGVYKLAYKSEDPNWEDLCDKEIERIYQELYDKFGVRRLTQEEAEKEFGFKKGQY